MFTTDTNQSMYAYIKENNLDNEAIKLVYFGRKFTFGKVWRDVDCLASFLYEHGVKKGDSVVLCLPNIPQAVVALYAVNKIGAIANIVHPKIGTKALLKIIHETATSWVFLYSKACVQHGKALKKEGVNTVNCRIGEYMGGIKKMIVGLKELVSYAHATIDFRRTVMHNTELDVPVGGKDPAVYLHSSGTTGQPKTVVLSSYAMNELAGKACPWVGKQVDLGRGDSSVMLLPLFHGFGLGVCLHYPMLSGKNILLPAFDAKKAVELIKKYPSSMICAVPSMLARMYKQKNFVGPHLKSIKTFFIGGDKLDDKLRETVENTLEKCGSNARLYEGFGLSEFASLTHLNIKHRTDGTVGQPMPTVKAKIVDKEGNVCPPGTEGELYMTGTSMMIGYLNQKTDFVQDEQGENWFPTGDYGYIDEDGFLYYRGRLKRLIKIGGVNIFPQEVESVACTLKEVENACAVRILQNGKPAIRLLVVLREKGHFTPRLKAKIKDAVRDNILPYAVPREIEVVDSIRLNTMGKSDYKFYEDGEKNNAGSFIGREKRRKDKKSEINKKRKEYTVVKPVIPIRREETKAKNEKE